MFRSEGGPIRRPRGRERQVTYRVALLKSAHLTRFTAHRDATPSQTLTVPLSMSSEAFKEALRANITGCPENFVLCRVNMARDIIPLNESCPAELQETHVLNRSALYLLPKETSLEPSLARATASTLTSQPTAQPQGAPPVAVLALPHSNPAPSAPQPAPQAAPPVNELVQLQTEPALSGPQLSETSDVGDILRALSQDICPEAPSANQVNVIRGEEFDCALCAFRRAAFDPKSKIDIMFVDDEGNTEGAVDAGGPTREFSRLLIGGIEKCSLFEGPEGCKSLALDAVALHRNTYREAGRMLAVCLVQGGVSPHFFSQTLYCQVAGMPTGPACIEEVWDHSLREKLELIRQADTVQGVRDAINDAADVLAPLGGLMYVTAVEQKQELLQAVIDFYCHGRVQAALQQFREGLLTLGLLDKVVLNPQGFEAIFLQDKTPLTAQILRELFVPVLSPAGSNRRRLENRAVMFWRDWLLEVEGGESSVGLEDILIFATGLKKVPAMGFIPQPELHFLTDGPSRFPKANTCSLALKLPVTVSFEDFRENMAFGILGAGQFGEA